MNSTWRTRGAPRLKITIINWSLTFLLSSSLFSACNTPNFLKLVSKNRFKLMWSKTKIFKITSPMSLHGPPHKNLAIKKCSSATKKETKSAAVLVCRKSVHLRQLSWRLTCRCPGHPSGARAFHNSGRTHEKSAQIGKNHLFPRHTMRNVHFRKCEFCSFFQPTQNDEAC
jgi:hypothetical protein